MEPAESEILPAAQKMTLAYLGEAERSRLAPAFALDFRLARIVATASEPILAQMRLAWWREMLAKAGSKRPQGDAVLDAITEHWNGEEHVFVGMIDAWEELLLSRSLDAGNAFAIAKGRGNFIVRTLEIFGGQTDREGFEALGLRWALADMAAHCTARVERDLLVALARDLRPNRAPLLRNLRGLAVLDALARHALRRGGRPLAEGRCGALVAFRAGLIGR